MKKRTKKILIISITVIAIFALVIASTMKVEYGTGQWNLNRTVGFKKGTSIFCPLCLE